ncbi:MAG TPA: DUF4388 domain-containing protein [Thermoanaerobaculia bacterium]|nr:DUF4388 domain-containing protein [Thermoanaerobaculia bacterium]
MAVEGSLDLFRLPEILQVISHQGKTGILTVQGADDIIAVSFLEGRIVAADALNETTEEGLGAVLVEEGRVPTDVLRRLVARSETEGVRLADLLVGEGRVDRDELLEALRLQTLRLLLSLLDWREGEFKFYGGDEVSYEEGFRAIGVDELLLRALEDGGGAVTRDVPVPESRLRRLDASRPVRVRQPASLNELPPPPSEEDSAVWLTPEEERVLSAVGPGRTVEEVARQAAVPTDRARYVLFRLTREGLVAPAAPAAAASSPERRPQPAAAPAPAPRERPGRSVEAPAAVLDDEEEPAARPAARSLAAPLAGAVALLAAVLLLVAAAAGPVAFLLPFPWLGEERASVHATRDSARLLELDLAAKTFFLLRGRFPDDLQELVDLGLLRAEDVADSRGRRLAFEPREGSYVLRPLVAGGAHGAPGAEPEEAFREGVAGNFLLDPEFLAGSHAATGTEPPLVLLD